MRLFTGTLIDFAPLDRQIEKIRQIRDSYRALTEEHFGKSIADLLNDEDGMTKPQR